MAENFKINESVIKNGANSYHNITKIVNINRA